MVPGGGKFLYPKLGYTQKLGDWKGLRIGEWNGWKVRKIDEGKVGLWTK